MIEITLFEDENLEGYTLVECFPGAGLVGPMAGSYIVEKLKMEYVGYIHSDAFPPIAAIHNSTPMFPSRIYKDEKYKLVLLISEFTIPSEVVYQLGMEVLSFARKNRVSRIISINGMPAQKLTETVYVTSSDSAMLKKAASMDMKPIKEGVVAGVSAMLLTNSHLFEISAVNILVEVNPSIMDPKYAEIALRGLNELISINIDLNELDKEAKIVEEKIRTMLKKVKESPEHYKNATEAAGPSMYA
jgi:uncharacterized protein